MTHLRSAAVDAVIPCGFDPAELAPVGRDARAALGIGPGEFVVLQLGRLVPRKGIDNVIHAIARSSAAMACARAW